MEISDLQEKDVHKQDETRWTDDLWARGFVPDAGRLMMLMIKPLYLK